MKEYTKEFAIFDFKVLFWKLAEDGSGFYADYIFTGESKEWYEILSDEVNDAVKYLFKKEIKTEERNYNQENYMTFSYDEAFLEEQQVPFSEIRNELSFIVKSLMQEERTYDKLEKKNIYYVDQYNQKTNILYTPLCQVKGERAEKTSVFFKHVVETLQKEYQVEVKYLSNYSAVIYYKGYALDLEKPKAIVEDLLIDSDVSVNKVKFADPMIKETSKRYKVLYDWAKDLRDNYSEEEEIIKDKC